MNRAKISCSVCKWSVDVSGDTEKELWSACEAATIELHARCPSHGMNIEFGKLADTFPITVTCDDCADSPPFVIEDGTDSMLGLATILCHSRHEGHGLTVQWKDSKVSSPPRAVPAKRAGRGRK